MSLRREIPTVDNRRVLTPGETIRVRRQRLKWTITTAAQKAGINRETVVSIEKDRGVTTRRLDAYKAALDEAEKENALSSPVIASSTTAVDVTDAIKKERQRFRSYLQEIESVALATVEDVRARIARLDAEEAEGQRKRG